MGRCNHHTWKQICCPSDVLFSTTTRSFSSWGGHYSTHTIYTAPLRSGAIYSRTRSTTSPTSHMFCGGQELGIAWHCWVCLPQSRWGKDMNVQRSCYVRENIFSSTEFTRSSCKNNTWTFFEKKKPTFFSYLTVICHIHECTTQQHLMAVLQWLMWSHWTITCFDTLAQMFFLTTAYLTSQKQ